MVRHVNVVIPHQYADIVLKELKISPFVFKLASFRTEYTTHVDFKVRPKHLQSVITSLSDIGCGEAFGSIDVFSLVMSRPAIAYKGQKPIKKKREYAISDRMTIDEIQDLIEEGNHLTFDYIALMALASLIAGAGLLGDSSTAVIASMLVSPLMGPILSMTFGLATMKMNIVMRGFRNEMIGIVVSLVVGFTMGLIASQIYDPDFRSSEMMSRGTVASLNLSLIVAGPSGMGIILAVSKGGFNAIVGTAISASLLPPVVNCGICLGLGLVHWTVEANREDARTFINVGGMSIVLWATNFVLILLVGFLTFRYVKKVRPLTAKAAQQLPPRITTPESEILIAGQFEDEYFSEDDVMQQPLMAGYDETYVDRMHGQRGVLDSAVTMHMQTDESYTSLASYGIGGSSTTRHRMAIDKSGGSGDS